ncbi:MAG TPA: hypothetical protein VF669_01635 [Tepidisphaeraceae bacterium]|jgi:hypothetical protein
MMRLRPLLLTFALLSLSCSPQGNKGKPAPGDGPVAGVKLQGVNLNDPVRPIPHDQPIIIGAAKNEWASFSLQITNLPASAPRAGYSLRIHAPELPEGKATISAKNFQAAQILPMPVDVNRAGYVRQTGLSVSDHPLPRALLPIKQEDGIVDLSALRDPNNPLDPSSRAKQSNEPLLLWVDLHVPAQTTPGEYTASVDLVPNGTRKPVVSVPVKITVYDFELPADRHLLMISQIDWEDLKRLYPEQFETVAPRLLSRRDERCAGTVQVLDSLQKLAQAHRTQVSVPRLQPVVKWQLGNTRVDWEDLDTVIEPWLSGQTFDDHIPLGYWPLPAVDFLDQVEKQSQLDYWAQAAAHFDEKNWLNRSAVWIESLSSGRPSSAESLELSARAAEILARHPKMRVTLPLEEDQLQLASSRNQNFIQTKTTERVLASAPGIVFSSPLKSWPDGVARPAHWLRTDIPGLVPYVGAGGDERDVRVWSHLAFLRQASMILWGSPLPRTDTPRQAADPNDLIWFYPGQWFGVNNPLPTIQLKWLRRAQQDYEYLLLNKQRGDATNAALIARLITKPVEIAPGQIPDPTYSLMCGTSDHTAWSEALRLLSSRILLRTPGQPLDNLRRDALDLQLLRWCAPQEQPVLMNRTVQWQIDRPPGAIASHWLNLRVGIDIYNASDVRPDQNLLQWTAMPKGWEVKPQPAVIPALSTYRVHRNAMEARYNLTAVDSRDHRAAELTFTNGYNRQETRLKLFLPVAPSDRLPPGGLKIDGSLEDWNEADAVQAGPMIRMFNRPALHKQEMQLAQSNAQVFTGWADENLYVAFKLDGMSKNRIEQSRNFVDYQFRRAWGEDLCEILLQPLFADNTAGPVLHIVCKPTGHWVERKSDGRTSADPWQPYEGAGMRYMAKLDTSTGTWRGEVAIPWKAIMESNKGIPPFLRFNFSEHTHATGESSSWAGPVDFGRDDNMTGILYLREPNEPGMAGQPNRTAPTIP